MRWHRDEYVALMTFADAPRPMFVELFGPLVGLEEEWRTQGATPEELDLTAFDWDYVVPCGCGGRTGPIGPPGVVIEETAEHRVERDMFGRTLHLDKRTATIPLPSDFPVRNMDDWLKLKPMFQFAPERIDEKQVQRAAGARDRGELVVAGIPGAFDMARELMGEQVACMAYYDQPELMHDLLDTMRDTAMRTLEPISRRVTIDQLSVHEDFAGRSGPLIGPGQLRDFVQPYYRAVWDLLHDRGCRIFQIDTDGNVNCILDELVACGINSMLPVEPAAGMDPVAVRQRMGNSMAMLGGIDKHVLRRSQAEIRRELEHKMQPAMRQGGMVFGLDHRIPNGTPLASYRYYVDTGRQILGLPTRTPERRGWRRMAF